MASLFLDTFAGVAGNTVHSRASDAGGTMVNYGSGSALLVSGGGCRPSGTCRLVAPVDVNDIEVEGILNILTSGVANHYAGFSLAVNSAVTNTYAAQFFNYSTGLLSSWGQFNKAGTNTNSYTRSPTQEPYLTAGQHTVQFSRFGDIFRSWLDGRELMRFKPSSTYLGAFQRPGIFGDGGSATASTGSQWKRFEVFNTRFDFNQVQFVGDSMTEGTYYDNSGVLSAVLQAEKWPARVMASLYAAGYEGRWANVGISGKRIETMETDAALTPTDSNALFGVGGWGYDTVVNAGADLNVCVFFGGINDIIALAGGTATVISRIQTFVANRRTAGHSHVFICTIPHCDWNVLQGRNTATYNGYVDTINAWIIANANLFDGVIRFDQVTELNDYTNATYRSQYDGIHWLPAAMPFVADAVFNIVQSVLSSSITVTSPASAAIRLTGVSANITWDSANVDNVDIAASIDNGSTYPLVVASNIANTGSYAWTPDADHVSATAKVKVTDHDDTDTFDESDGFIVATTESAGGVSLIGNGLIRGVQ